MSFIFNEDNLQKFNKLKKRYPKIDALTLPCLWLVKEQIGYISHESMKYLANLLQTSPMQIYSIASFYTMFNLKPLGKYHIEVCKTLSCNLCGSDEISSFLQDYLQIKPGETTKDGKFSLSMSECLGSCGTSPVVSINYEYYQNMTIEKLKQILKDLS